MPSFRHEAPLVLLRECPDLVAHLMRELFGVAVPAYREVHVVDADFTQLLPTSFHADLVLRFDSDAPVMGVVVERQGRADDQKRYSWPLYAAALHAKLACQICLVVIAETDAVAAWAARPIDSLQIGSSFVPLVVGPSTVPRITSVVRAAQAPELAVFSALVHGNRRGGLDVVLPALAAVEALADDYARLYFDMIVGALTDARRRGLEVRMRTRDYEYQTDFARRYVAQGEAKGRAEALLAVLAARGLDPSQQQESTIRRCTDVQMLDRWIVRAVTADSVGDVLDSSGSTP